MLLYNSRSLDEKVTTDCQVLCSEESHVVENILNVSNHRHRRHLRYTAILSSSAFISLIFFVYTSTCEPVRIRTNNECINMEM